MEPYKTVYVLAYQAPKGTTQVRGKEALEAAKLLGIVAPFLSSDDSVMGMDKYHRSITGQKIWKKEVPNI
jgi:hypothetical protein